MPLKPPYGAYNEIVDEASISTPIQESDAMAAALIKKGSRISNVIVFLSTWACIKIPQELVELQFLGLKFMASRLILIIFFVMIMGLFVEQIMERSNKKPLKIIMEWGSMKNIVYKPIGIIHSPFIEPGGTPVQPAGAKGIKGTVEIFPEYEKGLKDIEGFFHIILLYHFHLSKTASLVSKPFMDDTTHGIFAIRGPNRPNPIGISVVRLIQVKDNVLHVRDLDIVDRTPLLDIKPYVPKFDRAEATRIGWLEKNVNKLIETKDDGRFTR